VNGEMVLKEEDGPERVNDIMTSSSLSFGIDLVRFKLILILKTWYGF